MNERQVPLGSSGETEACAALHLNEAQWDFRVHYVTGGVPVVLECTDPLVVEESTILMKEVQNRIHIPECHHHYGGLVMFFTMFSCSSGDQDLPQVVAS